VSAGSAGGVRALLLLDPLLCMCKRLQQLNTVTPSVDGRLRSAKVPIHICHKPLLHLLLQLSQQLTSRVLLLLLLLTLQCLHWC
jgi:hypothetical protein